MMGRSYDPRGATLLLGCSANVNGLARAMIDDDGGANDISA